MTLQIGRYILVSSLEVTVACAPSSAHPYPVILAEGTFASMYNSFGAVSPDLVNSGYCVYAFNYGQTITVQRLLRHGRHRRPAGQLSTEVNKVLSETGASKVDIVGWSQRRTTDIYGWMPCRRRLPGHLARGSAQPR